MSKKHTTLTHARVATRRETSLSATIFFAGNALGDCVIKDISVSGMKLYVPKIAWLPHYFEISSKRLPAKIKVQRIWDFGEEVGVQFIFDKSTSLADVTKKPFFSF